MLLILRTSKCPCLADFCCQVGAVCYKFLGIVKLLSASLLLASRLMMMFFRLVWRAGFRFFPLTKTDIK